MVCELNSGEMTPFDELDEYIQDALDLVDFANGSATSGWGGLRARMGRRARFGLTMIAVGRPSRRPRR